MRLRQPPGLVASAPENKPAPAPLTVVSVVGRDYRDAETLSIRWADIRSVEKRRAHHMKQIAVTLADGQEFVFDNGIMSVDKLAALIQG